MKRLADSALAKLSVDFEGDSIPAVEGEPVACALLASGENVFARSIKYHRPRGPYCMSGSCSHCLMRIDGMPNLFACRTPVRPGMRVERQNAYPSVKVDLFESIDWLFPRGLDHHEMFAGVPVAEKVMAKVARHLAGLGLLPDQPAPVRMEAAVMKTRVAIAGGGASGLSAALSLKQKSIPFLLLEQNPFLGGRLVTGAPTENDPAVPALDAPAASVRLNTTLIGLYEDENGRFLAAVSQEPEGARMIKVYAERFLICTGGHPQLPPFENNDLPGIYDGRAASLLIRRHRVGIGEKIAMLGDPREMAPLERLLVDNDAKVVLALGWNPYAEDGVREVKAHGRSSVSGVSFRKGTARAKKIGCDALVIALPPAPSFELARQGGARIVHEPKSGAFAVESLADGRTNGKGLFVAGEQRGVMTAREAWRSGERAAEAIAEELS